MKTLVMGVLLTALALTGAAWGQDPGKLPPTDNGGKAVKKITIEEVGETLKLMGYEPKAQKDKDGKVTGYRIELTRAGTKLNCRVSLAEDTIWIDNDLLVFNDANPATVPLLLGLLAEQDNLWPAYFVYYPDRKTLQLAMPLETRGQGLTTQAMRTTIDTFLDKWQIVKNAHDKLKAAETQKGQPAPPVKP